MEKLSNIANALSTNRRPMLLKDRLIAYRQAAPKASMRFSSMLRHHANDAVEKQYSCRHRAVNHMEQQDSNLKLNLGRRHGSLQSNRHQRAHHRNKDL